MVNAAFISLPVSEVVLGIWPIKNAILEFPFKAVPIFEFKLFYHFRQAIIEVSFDELHFCMLLD